MAQRARNRKQGSGEPVNTGIGSMFTAFMKEHVDNSMALYERALENNIAPEMARLFLPAYSMYTTFRWTTSIHALVNFLELRLDGHAQKEIQLYAEACLELIKPQFPHTFEVIGLG